MKKRIVKLFKYKRWMDHVNFKNFECRISLLLSIIVALTIYYLDAYDLFSYYLIAFQNIILYTAQALIGMLGFVLAGIAILSSTLKRETLRKIEEINGVGTINHLFSSFNFLALNISFSIIIYFLMYIILNSPNELFSKFYFFLIVFILCYLISFTIFYAAALVSNCIKIFHISHTYEDILHDEKKLIDQANEVRIDFILNTLITGISKEEFTKRLEEFVDSSEVKDKEALKQYFRNYY